LFGSIPQPSVILTLEDGTNKSFNIPKGQKFNVDGQIGGRAAEEIYGQHATSSAPSNPGRADLDRARHASSPGSGRGGSSKAPQDGQPGAFNRIPRLGLDRSLLLDATAAQTLSKLHCRALRAETCKQGEPGDEILEEFLLIRGSFAVRIQVPQALDDPPAQKGIPSVS
jgi:hypothetical protein